MIETHQKWHCGINSHDHVMLADAKKCQELRRAASNDAPGIPYGDFLVKNSKTNTGDTDMAKHFTGLPADQTAVDQMVKGFQDRQAEAERIAKARRALAELDGGRVLADGKPLGDTPGSDGSDLRLIKQALRTSYTGEAGLMRLFANRRAG